MDLLSLQLLIGSIMVGYSGTRLVYAIDSLADKTKLGKAFLRAVLLGAATFVALVTSLPELATTFYAIRMKSYVLAVSNIFGSNSLMIAMLFIADLFYREGTLFNVLGMESIFLAALGMGVTLIYLWGLLERRDQTIFRMGIDSALILFIQIFGWIAIYSKFS